MVFEILKQFENHHSNLFIVCYLKKQLCLQTDSNTMYRAEAWENKIYIQKVKCNNYGKFPIHVTSMFAQKMCCLYINRSNLNSNPVYKTEKNQQFNNLRNLQKIYLQGMSYITGKKIILY